VAETKEPTYFKTFILDEICKENGMDKFDASKAPVVIYKNIIDVLLIIADPDIVRDLYTRHNKLIDKTGKIRILFSTMMGRAFIFSEGDQEWKQKRVASQHAFYRDRVTQMTNTEKG
jgi:hypothetical protein